MSYSFGNLIEEGSKVAVKEATTSGSDFPAELRGVFDNLPSGSLISAVCVGAEWKSWENSTDQVSLTWEIQAPAELKGRRAFQNLKVYDNENHGRRFLAIYFQALKKAYPYGKEIPSTTQLAKDLVMAQANILVEEWELEDMPTNIDKKTGMLKTGNWYSDVTPYDESLAKVGTLKYPRVKPLLEAYNAKKQGDSASTSTEKSIAGFDSFDDDVPF